MRELSLTKRVPFILASLLVILLVAGGLLYYFKLKPTSKKPSAQSKLVKKQQEQAKEKPDPYKDWQVYSDPNYYFTLRYPKDWYLWPKKEARKVQLATSSTEVGTTALGGNALFTIEVLDNPRGLTFLDWYKAKYRRSFSGQELKTTYLKGFREEIPKEPYEVAVYTTLGQEVYRLSCLFPSGARDKYLPIFDKIAASFAFQQ